VGGLDGQVAVVSGGAGGVGHAIAQAYLGAGATAVLSRPESDALSDKSGLEALIDRAVLEHGRLDAVVLGAAGPGRCGPVATTSDEDWQSELDLNLGHVFWGIRRALHHMLPRRSGRIIVTSGVEGKLPRSGASGYVAAQHAVGGLVKSVAREVGTEGIAVNAILSGPVNGDSPSEFQALSKLGRHTTVDEVARVAVLLASPRVTSITGCLFPVDGGTMPY
jgi:3-hydroxybutyrate dehydrogenase